MAQEPERVQVWRWIWGKGWPVKTGEEPGLKVERIWPVEGSESARGSLSVWEERWKARVLTPAEGWNSLLKRRPDISRLIKAVCLTAAGRYEYSIGSPYTFPNRR